MNAHGMDVSVWQDDNSTAQQIDFEKAKANGMSFVYIKASQSTWSDPDYHYNWQAAKGLLLRGAYHFLVWETSPIRQADMFWALLKNDPGELPMVVDFEWWKETPANAMQILYGFTERLRSLTDRPLGIYTAKSYWDVHGNKAQYWKRFHLWLCDISGPVQVPAPWINWTFWQYTFKLDGPLYGAESKDLDGDWYNGSFQEMCQEFGIEQPNPQPQYTVYTPVVGMP